VVMNEGDLLQEMIIIGWNIVSFFINKENGFNRPRYL